MKRFITFDMLFKIGLLILGIWFLMEFHSFNQKGRYQPIGLNGNVLDTRTGIIYDDDDGSDGQPGAYAEDTSHIQLIRDDGSYRNALSPGVP